VKENWRPPDSDLVFNVLRAVGGFQGGNGVGAAEPLGGFNRGLTDLLFRAGQVGHNVVQGFGVVIHGPILQAVNLGRVFFCRKHHIGDGRHRGGRGRGRLHSIRRNIRGRWRSGWRDFRAEEERTALRPGMGHLPPIKSHVHAEISVEQDQEMLDRVERAGTHGVTHDYLGHR
jgi:hypothetical protein